jgi:hypothetical protein
MDYNGPNAEDTPNPANLKRSTLKRGLAWIKEELGTISIALVGALLILLSIRSQKLVERSWPHHGEVAGYLIEHLGAVMIVAVLVRVAIEEGTERKFLWSVNHLVQDEIKKSINKSSVESIQPLKDVIDQAKHSIEQLATGLTYKIIQNLDPNLRKVLEAYVLNSPFVRPQYTLELTLRPFPQDLNSDILEVSVRTLYTIKNRTDDRAKYECESWLDDVVRPSGNSGCKFTWFSFEELDTEGEESASFPYDLSVLEREGRIYSGDGTLRLKFPIMIGKGATYRVTIEGKQLMRRHDVFVWNVVTLTNQIDLTVNLDGVTLSELDIFPRALHHAAGQAEKKNHDRGVMMTLHQVFLPYQGVEVRWSPHIHPELSQTQQNQDMPQ